MSYGVGGVAKGGDDCRYWMHEIGVYPPKEQIVSPAMNFEVANLSTHSSARYAVWRGAS